MMHEAPLLRRRSYEIILESAKASVASQCAADARSCGAGDGKRGPVLRSSTARAALAVASGVLLLLSLATDGIIARDAKDPSDSVTDPTPRLQHAGLTGERALRDEITTDTLELERRLEEKDIELAWEKQHVSSVVESQHMMADKMKDQIAKERGALTDMDHLLKLVAKDSDARQHAVEEELSRERRENRRLHESLDVALKHLAEARAHQAKQPPGSQVEEARGEAKSSERQLRGVPANQYQPGDNIEIIEHRADGEIILHPGKSTYLLDYISYRNSGTHLLLLHVVSPRHCLPCQHRWYLQFGQTRFRYLASKTKE